MSAFAPVLRRLLAGEPLSADEAAGLIGAIMDGTMTPVQAAALLTALAMRGETVDEIAGSARAMRERAVRLDHGLPLVADVVGTGGDGAGTINISTMAALLVAAAGVPVAKHGNRAASGACGSADVLEACGLRLDLPPATAARMLRETGFAFLFAPLYHPAMRNVAPVRRELGVRTVFNVLGPLTNPASATHMVVGVARADLLEPVAEVLRRLGVRRAAVVHAGSGIDEIAGEGTTEILYTGAAGVRRDVVDPALFGVQASLDDLRVSTIEDAASAFAAILQGERSSRADVVVLNAALALFVADAASSLAAAFERVRALQRDGAGWRIFMRAREIAGG